jgi:hypothetical protein
MHLDIRIYVKLCFITSAKITFPLLQEIIKTFWIQSLLQEIIKCEGDTKIEHLFSAVKERLSFLIFNKDRICNFFGHEYFTEIVC